MDVTDFFRDASPEQAATAAQEPKASYLERYYAKHGAPEKAPWFSVPAGVYVCEITNVSVSEDGKVDLLYDIAEGAHKGAYHAADLKFDWTHKKTLGVSSEYALVRTFADLAAITASNDGFTAEEAFIDGEWGDFVGKRVGIALRAEQYLNKVGIVCDKLNPVRLVPVSEVEDTPVPEPKLLDEHRTA